MKRKISVFVLFTILFFSFSLISCNEKICNHEFNYTITKEATCTSEGLKVLTCSICGYEKTETIAKDLNNHPYASEWSYNEAYHWHKRTCIHDEVVERKTEHDWGSWNITKKATSNEEGTKERTCIVCGYTDIQTIPFECAHKYETPSYTWNEDYSKCTATRICQNDNSHIETETVNTVSAIQQATCTAEEITSYTATFTNSSFKTQVKNIKTGNKLDHTYSWFFVDEQTHNGVCSCGDTITGNHEVDEGVEIENGDVVYTCKYCNHQFVIEKEPGVYSVIFFDNGIVLSSTSFTEKTSVNITIPNNPSRIGKRFIGWDKDVSTIKTEKLTESCIISAVYVDEYTISFCNEENKIIKEVKYAPTVDNIDNIVYPTLDEKEGYTLNWSINKEELVNIENNVYIKAEYEINKYIVKFYDYDNTILDTQEVLYNLSAKAPLNITDWYFDYISRTGYILKGWETKDSLVKIELTDGFDGNINNICKNLEFYPYYEVGCNEPTLIVSYNSNSQLSLSILIPYNYQVSSISFKVNYDLEINKFNYSLIDTSVFVDSTGDCSNFVVNEREKYFSYYFVDSTLKGINVKEKKSYLIANILFNDQTGDVISMSDKDLIDIFKLEVDECKIVYRINDEYKTETLKIIFEE